MKLHTGKKANEWSHVNEEAAHKDTQWQKGH